eukprot:CAMPEP_0172784094 /NCGR_PEP_ID=MMETSP1074-20121228/204769_1 /TAXON_ID=2916 /ORGANISM="Ceratium fusus, Strain PA161109" /LENGTH=856 /DNA_ID=CAMNT_0013621093 /DNA_START=41 /DNA_END=2611 /DNA_ORIENTATION=-
MASEPQSSSTLVAVATAQRDEDPLQPCCAIVCQRHKVRGALELKDLQLVDSPKLTKMCGPKSAAIFHARFLCFRSNKFLWATEEVKVCQHCDWTSTNYGVSRCLEHCVGGINESAWAHYGNPPLGKKELKEMTRLRRGRTNCLNDCVSMLDKEEILALIAEGVKAAETKASWLGWEDPGKLGKTTAWGECRQSYCQQLQACSVANGAGAFRSTVEPFTVTLHEAISIGQYKKMSPQTLKRRLLEVNALIQAEKKELVRIGAPWNLALDSATLKNEGSIMLNFVLCNDVGDILLLDIREAGYKKKTAAFHAAWFDDVVAKYADWSYISAVDTDGPSVMRKMKVDLEARLIGLNIRPSFLFCGEHMADNLCKDLEKIVPWLQHELKAAHTIIGYIRKKKMFRRLVERAIEKALKHKVIEAKRKFVLRRRTRFVSGHKMLAFGARSVHVRPAIGIALFSLMYRCLCYPCRFVSGHKMLDGFNVNFKVLDDIFDDAGKANSKVIRIVGKQAKDIERYREIQKLVKRRARLERSKRAEELLRPVTLFCRSVACFEQCFSASVPLALWVQASLKHVLAKVDFIDTMASEPNNAGKTQRAQALEEVLTNRVGYWLQDEHRAAFIMNPAMRGIVRTHAPPDWTAELVWDGAAAWTALKTATWRLLDQWFPGDAMMKAELEHYLLGTGEFRGIVWPAVDEISVQDVFRRGLSSGWWKARAPAARLVLFASRVLSMRSCSTVAELAWASMSRQNQPIRNKLTFPTRRVVEDVRYNAKCLKRFNEPPEGLPRVKLPPRKKRKLLWQPTKNIVDESLLGDIHDCGSSEDSSESTGDDSSDSNGDGTSSSEQSSGEIDVGALLSDSDSE